MGARKTTEGLKRLLMALAVATAVTVAAVGVFAQGNWRSPALQTSNVELTAGRLRVRCVYSVEHARPAPSPVTISTTLDRTALVRRYLEDAGLGREEAVRWASLFQRVTGNHLMRGGHPLTLYKDPDTGALRGFRYNLDFRRAIMELALGEDVLRVWQLPILYESRPVSVAFRVQSNFRRAAAAHGVPNQIVRVLEEAFESRHPLDRLAPGSTVKLIYKEKVARDGTWHLPTEVEAAQLEVGAGKKISAFAFSDGTSDTCLYDAQGQELGIQTLQFPVHFNYISSGFTFHRYHPLLHIYRPHLGVDLATKYGEPVRAVAGGRVATAGWCGELGRCVRIEHPGDMATIYGHLSKISTTAGATVQVGEIIGKVGSSGLSSGTHLHFAMEKGDRLVNPLTQHLGANHQISPRMRALFDKIKQRYSVALSRLPNFTSHIATAEASADEPTLTVPVSGKRVVRFRRHRHHHNRHLQTAGIAAAPDYESGL